MFIIVILLAISYIGKENLWIINIFRTKHKKINLFIDSQIFTCLMYFSLAYIYMIEGYMKKITYIYDDSKNTEEDKQKKKILIYNLIIIYIIVMLFIFLFVKKIMNKYQKNI
jgi:hypothetical protein